MPNTVIEDGAVISYSLLGEGCHIGRDIKITSGCVLGSKVTVKDAFLKAKYIKSKTVVKGMLLIFLI